MKSLKIKQTPSDCSPHSTIEITTSSSPPGCRGMLALGLSLGLLGLTSTIRAQIISDNFNSGSDVGWSPYEGSPGTRETKFPGGQYQLINHGSKDASGLFTRGASIRNDALYSSSFFQAVDVTTWDDNMIGFAGPFIMARLTPGQIAPGSTTGYLVTHFTGGQNGVQSLIGFIEFQTETTITSPDEFTGGTVLLPKVDPAKGYRFVFKSGPGDLGGLLIGELYDRYDLLEPIARGVARDDVNNSVHPSGVSGIGNFHVGEKDTADWTGTSDTTFDNYYASPNSNNFIGFTGVAQVANLVPAPQTLFYTIPVTNQITFNASAFDTTQIATNTLKLFLNNVDVSSQLSFTEVKTPLVGSPGTNFAVRFNGTLTPNTIYNGKIITLDTTGKGTTNTWAFDTFTTSGILTVEAEDYNYGGGLFQDNPPVSGLQPDGTQVAGSGPPSGGYYSADVAGDLITTIMGQPDVDYHEVNTPDLRQDADRNTAGHQYRSADFVNTVQARMERGRDVRPQYVSANVGEYFVLGLNAGEWMNYTRTFPSGNYKVYLRASSQKAQAMRLDEVTAGSTTSNQTTEVRGQFLVPNTGSSSRFRYVPLTDGAGNIQTLSLAGVRTLRLTALEASQKNVIDVGDLQLNYLMFVPAGTPSTGPFIASASPAAGTVLFDPEGTVQVSIVNRGTSVSAGTIQLKFDGVTVPATITPTATGATVSYKPPGFLLPNSTHTNSVVFSDGSVSQTNQWSFTVFNMPTLLPSDRESTGPDSSFTVQVHKAQNAKTTASVVDSFNNNITRAERQLAGTLGDVDTPGQTFVNEADTNGGFAALTFVEPDAIHYEECGGSTPLFGQAKFYPGIAPPVWDCSANGSPDHFAIAATIKLSLAAGAYRMGFDADDEVVVQAGAAGTNYQGTALRLMLGNSETYPGHRESGNGHNPDGSFDTSFDFAVQTNGVYNFRLVHEEGTGGARVDWYWINRTTGAKELVRPISLVSSATVNGPYTVDSTALINPSAKTVTVPKSGNTRFYRLSSSTGYTLGRPTISGSNVVLTYQ
jgi:hypothetical protein